MADQIIRRTDRPEYHVWRGMLQRCQNPNSPSYRLYGGRGIRVCERWNLSFRAFLHDMGERPSPTHVLDRFPDQNGNYEKSNCRWATPLEQANNRTDNRLLTFNGETRSVSAWARHVGMSCEALHQRLRLGWSLDRALQEPIRDDRVWLTFNGKRQTRNAWARELGIPSSVLIRRLKKWSVDRALSEPYVASVPMSATYNGATKLVSEWAAQFGIAARTLTERLVRGWPVEKALLTPVEYRRPSDRDFVL